MRRSEIALSLLLASCVVPLDHEFDAPPPGDDAGAPPVVSGCAPLPGASGDLRSIPTTGGATLWIADRAGATLSAGFAVGAGAAADCRGWSAAPLGGIVAPSPVRPDGLVAPLDLADADGALLLYFELFAPDAGAPLGLRPLGFGVATRDATTGTFTPGASLLWSADRPSYGVSAMVENDQVILHGCRSAGDFASDCFVARAPAARAADGSSYEFWAGDRWSNSADDAQPVVRGVGGAVSVRRSGERFVMTYAPTLGSTIEARSAPAPEGPWSSPTPLATCDLAAAGAGAFCAGGRQHPELAPPASLAVTYDARSFAADAGASTPRLGVLPIPSALP